MSSTQQKRWRNRITWLKVPLTRRRLLIAWKSALAVGIAWMVAPLMPGVADEYPYYAPLGALLSMQSTLKGSAKYGLQIFGGLAFGIGLAAAVLVFGAPNLLTISLVVAVGVLIGGMRWLGAPGQEYLPIAALFVLIIGGQNAEQYSVGYLVQMGVGIIVGLLINLLIVPPLAFGAASQQFSRFRNNLVDHLNEMGDALTENWPPEREEWATRNRSLAATAVEVREALYLADESRRGNPRARSTRHRRDLSEDYADLDAMENVTFHVRDLTEVLAGAVWGAPYPVDLPAHVCTALSEAMRAVAELLATWDSGTKDPEVMRKAENVIGQLMNKVSEAPTSSPSSVTATAALVMALHRIVQTVQPRLTAREGEDSRTQPEMESP